MKDKSEQGYALLVVVLITVLVMGFFTFFVTASLNNANQEQTVDENHLKVAAAEMGVDHYVAELTIVYNSLLKPEVKNSKELYDTFKNTVSEGYSEIRKDNIAESYYYQGQIVSGEEEEELIQTEDGEKISVSGVVQGNNTNSERQEELGFTVTFPVPPFISDNNQDDDNREEEDLRSITMPENPCNSNHDDGEILDGKCYVDDVRLIPSDMINDNNIEREEISLFVFNDELSLNNKVKFIDSFIYVKGTFKIGNKFEPEDTQIYIDGDFYFGPGNTLELDKDSKICVTGTIYTLNNGKELDKERLNKGDGLVYTLNEDYVQYGGVFVENEEELKNKCGFTESSSDPEIWFPPEKTDVEYN